MTSGSFFGAHNSKPGLCTILLTPLFLLMDVMEDGRLAIVIGITLVFGAGMAAGHFFGMAP